MDEESIKTKFENNSKNLDDILSSQISSRDKIGLGYDNKMKSEGFSFTNQGRNRRDCAAAIKSPNIKKEGQKSSPSSHNKYITDMMPEKPMKSRVHQIFFGQCYTCHKFGHMTSDCKKKKGWKRMEDVKQ